MVCEMKTDNSSVGLAMSLRKRELKSEKKKINDASCQVDSTDLMMHFACTMYIQPFYGFSLLYAKR